MEGKIIEGKKALEWLIEGNLEYIEAKHSLGDVSKEKRLHTHHHGQNPFAVILACSDSRVIPESIFMKGIGDLFVIRVAGNVLDDFGYGSIEYALDHLGCKLVLVLGHTRCGAIAASLEGHHESFVGKITSTIQKSIGDTKDSLLAAKRNVCAEIEKIDELILKKKDKFQDVLIKGGIYHTNSGRVEIL